jgi:hypothetical protein
MVRDFAAPIVGVLHFTSLITCVRFRSSPTNVYSTVFDRSPTIYYLFPRLRRQLAVKLQFPNYFVKGKGGTR